METSGRPLQSPVPTAGHLNTQPIWHWAAELGAYARQAKRVRPVLIALGLVAATTLCLMAITHFISLQQVTSAYLIPVLIAAIRLGVVPAVVAAVGGIAASAFLFYPPIYDFRIYSQVQLIDLPLFVVVAMVTGQLAARVQTHARLAEEREHEMRALYAFSRQLAVATDATQIYAAIENHLSHITRCRIAYYEAGTSPGAAGTVPASVRAALADFSRHGDGTAVWAPDDQTGGLWLICPVSRKNNAFGLVAIDVGQVSDEDAAAARHRIEAVLADAAATLERLDVARAIGEARLRAEADTLRTALLNSVTHGLRTPLASIIGSASVLGQSPAVEREPRLSELVGIVRDEAERLNGDIQRLLDASRISTHGVRPHAAWADVADIVNAAADRQRRALAAHRVEVHLADDLPLIHVDPILIEQALYEVLDNAAKYSPAGSIIRIDAYSRNGEVVIDVKDAGAGLAPEEREQVFQRFYRGPRVIETTSGSGLGLWIARAFVTACAGRIDAASEGAWCGTVVTLAFPEAQVANGPTRGAMDE